MNTASTAIHHFLYGIGIGQISEHDLFAPA